MINRNAIETAVKHIAARGSRPVNQGTDACELMAILCVANGAAKGYMWTKKAVNWREASARYAFKEITLAGLKGWEGISG